MKTASKLIAEQSRQKPDKATARKKQLLIISDSSERESELRATLNLGEIEITSLRSPLELGRFPHRKYDLAVVDVGPGQIAGILKALRSSKEYSATSVLVECSRIATEPGFAGLLPQYRAMPYCQHDLITLVKSQIAPAARIPRERRIL